MHLSLFSAGIFSEHHSVSLKTGRMIPRKRRRGSKEFTRVLSLPIGTTTDTIPFRSEMSTRLHLNSCTYTRDRVFFVQETLRICQVYSRTMHAPHVFRSPSTTTGLQIGFKALGGLDSLTLEAPRWHCQRLHDQLLAGEALFSVSI